MSRFSNTFIDADLVLNMDRRFKDYNRTPYTFFDLFGQLKNIETFHFIFLFAKKVYQKTACTYELPQN
jgi:hypothetical protein